ncbi:hypothetical protein [Litorilituus lipolyticus]|uniref:Uncharacterized protein n=1 Tax=Litorilituus lipolyticus TaxID=2491017 RepID=A0A502KZR2_9GAMM|nr:hypothetical protein [Litorilituus lipolyticus]TPH15163.1 hypothetical protein EPA86_10115 [Litorilituus lipolyticus]
MNKVIEILTEMAQNASADIEQLAAQVSSEQAEAIINKDITALERQLDICPDIKCFLIPAEDEEPSKKEEEKEEESDVKSVVSF